MPLVTILVRDMLMKFFFNKPRRDGASASSHDIDTRYGWKNIQSHILWQIVTSGTHNISKAWSKINLSIVNLVSISWLEAFLHHLLGWFKKFSIKVSHVQLYLSLSFHTSAAEGAQGRTVYLICALSFFICFVSVLLSVYNYVFHECVMSSSSIKF